MHATRTRYFLIFAMLLSFQNICIAEDFDAGLVVETSPDKAYIQVCDKNYKVSRVFTLAEPDKPLEATADMITEGSLVKVVRGNKEADFWHAKSVTVYTGEMEILMREEMELPQQESPESAPSRKETPKTEPSPGEIKVEDGIYTN